MQHFMLFSVNFEFFYVVSLDFVVLGLVFEDVLPSQYLGLVLKTKPNTTKSSDTT